jgi:hypothetical protein
VEPDLPRPAAPAASAPPEERGLGEIVVTGSRRREAADSANAEGSPTVGAIASQYATSKIRPPPFERSPETWYAYVEKLRAEGKTAEADRQLERLEKAHPGWVERYLKDRAGQ